MDSKEDEESQMHLITRSQKGLDEMPGEEEEMRLVNGGTVEMEVGRAVQHIVTDVNTIMFCPNCQSWINMVSICNVSICKEKIVRPETPEVSKCVSFFSLFIPWGDGIKLWPFGNNKTHAANKKDTDEMLGEEEKIGELEIERAINYVDTYGDTSMFCRNCNICLTKVLVRKRRVIQPPYPNSSGKSMAKREDHIQNFVDVTYSSFVSSAIIECDSEEDEEPHKDVIIKTLGGKGKIKPN